MTLQDDGDIIRGIGYVAIYSAYVEEIIDILIAVTEPLSTKTKDVSKQQTSAKIKALKQRLNRLDATEFAELINDLDVCQSLLNARHDVLHDRIYAQIGGPPMFHPARPERMRRPASSIELYELANQLDACRSVLLRPTMLQIPNALARKGYGGNTDAG